MIVTMLTINPNKDSYLSDNVQCRLNGFILFGCEKCYICDRSMPLDILEFEHLYTSKENGIAVYPACPTCNKQKNNQNAANYFTSKGFTERYDEIANRLNEATNITQNERDEAYIIYMQQVINLSRATSLTIPESLVRLMASPIPRNLLKEIDLTGCFIGRKQVINHKLDQYFDISGVNIEG